MRLLVYSVVVLGVFLVHVGCEEDFYELLNITRDADTRTIRKAFKKLAITMHPDKNPDDPEAHDKFLRINRAYEVLKDEDLRKKYDLHGEEGLKEGGPTGRGFQSWRFYQHEFGIYDDDAEIITLSKADFEVSVEGTNDIWFINYYSPHCGHCHDLAPTWREVARELEGVVRIGAVNCEDDFHLCRMQHIRGYPSLIIYPSRERYMGDKTRKELIKFVLKHVKASVVTLTTSSFDTRMKSRDLSQRPWLICFCGEGGDCVSHSTAIKVAAILSDVVNVAEVDCYTSAKLCERLGVTAGTYYFPKQNVIEGQSVEITSLDPKEISLSVLEQLPDVEHLSEQDFQTAVRDASTGQANPWLIHFVDSSDHDLELRKLPEFLDNINVGRLDCRVMMQMCQQYHVLKLPAFVVFKRDNRFEVHHGRHTAHDVAAFAKESIKNLVTVLRPAEFQHRVLDDPEPWFVDFFSPKCPPCLRLLPEVRKTSRQMKGVKFGTVDCTQHHEFCRQYNIRSYPTTLLFNQTVPHQYHGHHAASAIIQFIKDTLNPPVRILTDVTFRAEVMSKSADEIWLVDFYAPWCGPCNQLTPEWNELARAFEDDERVKVGKVNCDDFPALCQQQNINSYPSIRLYPFKTTSAHSYRTFKGWHRDAHSLEAWVYEFMPTVAVDLTRQDVHTTVLTSSQPWLLDFYAPWCGHCQYFAPVFEKIGQKMKGRVNLGKVNCDQNHKICNQFQVHGYPTIRFYKGTTGQKQSVHGDELSQDMNHILSHLERNLPSVTARLKHAKDEL